MSSRTWGIRSVVGVLAALTLFAAGCSSSGSKAASPATKPAGATTTTGAVQNAQPISSGQGQVLVGTATGTSPCEVAQPTPVSPGQVGAGAGGAQTANVDVGEHGARGMVKQLPLTHAQRVEMEHEIEQARQAAAAYPTVKDAEASGYVRSTVYVPCIGAHYTNVDLVRSFDPRHPSELLYDGSSPDSKLVGLSYLVYHHNGPPGGFAGPNDRWHQHNSNGGLCFGPGNGVIGGENTSRAECARLGGHKALLIDIWMMHAWVVPGFECSWGVFSGECPELGGRLGGTAWQKPAAS
jgi:hypothetical protein